MRELIEAYGELVDIYETATEEERVGLKIAMDTLTKRLTLSGKTVLIVGGRDKGKTHLFAELMEDRVELLVKERMEMLKSEPLEVIQVAYPNLKNSLSIKQENKQFYKGIAK